MMRTSLGLIALGVVLASCQKEEEEPLDLGDPPEELIIPDLSQIDLAGAYADALTLAVQTDLRVPWNAHVRSLGEREPGCPDIYLGNPDIEGQNDIPEDGPGLSWKDLCATTTGQTYGGLLYWESELQVEGDPDTAEGRTSEGERRLIGDSLVGDGDAVLFEFDGEGTEALTIVEAAGGYNRWIHSSLIEGTSSGSYPFDPATSITPGGWRTDMYLYATGGDADTLEARGNVFLFDDLMHDRFDSVAMDISFVGPTGAGPEDCTLEPDGWIGIRDQDAFWYDIVFNPRYTADSSDEYPNDPYTGCDGCGTVYIRGLEQPQLEVCLDLTFVWGGMLSPPDPEEFVLVWREVE